MPEKGFQFLEFKGQSNTKHSIVAIKTAVWDENATMGIGSEKVAKGLNNNDSAVDGILFMNRLLEKEFQGTPGTAAQICQQLSIIKEITPEHLWDAEDKMPIGDLLEDIHA